MIGLLMGALVLLSGGNTPKVMKVRMYYKDENQKKEILMKHPDILTGKVKEKWFEAFLTEKEYNEFKTMGIKMEIQIPDMKAFFESNFDNQIFMTFGKYYTFSEMEQEILQIASQYPDITELDTIGWSWYGRPIYLMKISDNPEIYEGEPAGLFTGVHHAREPIGCSICMAFIKWLCENYNGSGGAGDTATFLVNEREIYVVPVVNPDGYVFNESYEDPWGNGWRKNQRDNDNNGEFNTDYDGVDLNRNYGYMWGYDDQGSSPNPGAETYRGPSAFSEPEIQCIRELCINYPPQVAINYHSYSNLIIVPWGYIDDYPPYEDSVLFMSWADTMSNWNGYEIGNAASTVGYLANGVSDDWMYGEQNEKPPIYAFTFEVGNSFWEGANDTNIILQQIDETQPCMIFLLYRAGTLVNVKEEISIKEFKEVFSYFIKDTELPKTLISLIGKGKLYNISGRKNAFFSNKGVYFLKYKNKNIKIVFMK
jgi:hypothetical protein